MADKFEAVIDDFVNKTKEKLLNIARDSIKLTIRECQTPVVKGGKMRVDTGFLRSSGVAALNRIPTGPDEGRKRMPGEVGVLPEYGRYEEESYLIPVLAKMKYGDTFYFGWTAKYAKYRELYDGFMDSAVVKWPETVSKVVKGMKNDD